MDGIAVKVDSISKSFKLPHEKTGSVKSAFIGIFRGKRTYEKQDVLKDISFEIKKGEFFGIVGRNGSGKSTLLKLIAGIYSPDQGVVVVKGKLTPFIELGVGFNPELTGRENVYLNGALLGFSRKEVDAMYDEIVEFAELRKFMDQKLKNYSSGMQVRLAFSIAIRAKSEVLVLDEVLAVGDIAFQRKCYEYFVQLRKEKRTVVLVTHDMSAVERFCDKALVISEGENQGVFAPRDAAVLYEKINLKHSAKNKIERKENNRWGSGEAKIEKVEVRCSGKASTEAATIRQGQNVDFVVKIKKQANKKDVVVGLAVYDEFGVSILGPNSIGHAFKTGDTAKHSIKNVPLNPGKYYLTVALFDKNTVEEFDHIEKAMQMDVLSTGVQQHGKINLFGEWSLEN